MKWHFRFIHANKLPLLALLININIFECFFFNYKAHGHGKGLHHLYPELTHQVGLLMEPAGHMCSAVHLHRCGLFYSQPQHIQRHQFSCSGDPTDAFVAKVLHYCTLQNPDSGFRDKTDIQMLVMYLKIHKGRKGTLFFAFHSDLFPCDLDNKGRIFLLTDSHFSQFTRNQLTGTIPFSQQIPFF